VFRLLGRLLHARVLGRPQLLVLRETRKPEVEVWMVCKVNGNDSGFVLMRKKSGSLKNILLSSLSLVFTCRLTLSSLQFSHLVSSDSRV
jgi:hypothetical protein